VAASEWYSKLVDDCKAQKLYRRGAEDHRGRLAIAVALFLGEYAALRDTVQNFQWIRDQSPGSAEALADTAFRSRWSTGWSLKIRRYHGLPADVKDSMPGSTATATRRVTLISTRSVRSAPTSISSATRRASTRDSRSSAKRTGGWKETSGPRICRFKEVVLEYQAAVRHWKQVSAAVVNGVGAAV
jgi:hypothetical protein